MSRVVTSIAFVCLAAQAQTPKLAFEVASIKPATALGPLGMRADRKGGPGTSDSGMYRCQNCPVYWVLSEAYDLQTFDYAGPEWLQNARFDFMAKVPAGTAKETFLMMLQNLLADRFKLAVHREKKEMSVYELTVAKNGPKFRESRPKDAPQDDDPPPGRLQRDADGFPVLTRGMTMAVVPGHARLHLDNEPVSSLVRMLSGQLQGPVIDATGLKAKYDFQVSWSFEENNASALAGAPAAMVDLYHPALIGAVQSQLGLRLEQKKGSIEVLVVDHIEKMPTEN